MLFVSFNGILLWWSLTFVPPSPYHVAKIFSSRYYHQRKYRYITRSLIGTRLLPSNPALVREVPFGEREHHMNLQYLLPSMCVLSIRVWSLSFVRGTLVISLTPDPTSLMWPPVLGESGGFMKGTTNCVISLTLSPL